jgi:lipid-A-disaccharide synthase
VRPSVLIIAGEASADNLVAPLLPRLRAALPDVEFFGVGSEGLARAGLERVADAKALGVVGLFEWLGRAGELAGIYRSVKEAVASRNVVAAILVDLPDFNLRLAPWLRERGIPVGYYVSPQVWAWRKNRVKKIRQRVDEMFVLFPFEETFYREHGVPVTFVGHPIRDGILRRGPLRPIEDVVAAPRIALLPGSRPTEHDRHLPLLRETLERVLAKYPNARTRIPVPPTIEPATVVRAFNGLPVDVVRETGPSAVAWADAALVASGTATLEAALVGTPFALFYRLNPATVWAARIIFRWNDGLLGLPNWLLGREVVPELVFEKARPERLAATLLGLLENDEARRGLFRDLATCRDRLGPPGAAERTAKALEAFLRRARESEFSPARGRLKRAEVVGEPGTSS